MASLLCRLYTFELQMHPNSSTYSQVFLRFHSLLMMVLLLWLTVSTPIVYAAQEDILVAWSDSGEDDNSNPLSGTNEEKVETGNNTLSEYLHEVHPPLPTMILPLAAFKAHAAESLLVFHPELISPPPEFAS